MKLKQKNLGKHSQFFVILLIKCLFRKGTKYGVMLAKIRYEWLTEGTGRMWATNNLNVLIKQHICTRIVTALYN